jgi:hypothetical protein
MTTVKTHVYSSFIGSGRRIREAMLHRKIRKSSRVIALALGAVLIAGIAVWLRATSARFMITQTDAVKGSNMQLAFRKILIADGKTNDGFKLVSYLYKASDCIPISYEVIFFDSSARAEDELHKKMEKASEIVQQGTANNEKGNIVGERYVANFVGSDQAKPHSAIILTRNSDLISITSSSLTHVLEFEKGLNGPNNRSAFPRIDSLSVVTFKSSAVTNGFTNDGVRFVREEFTSSDCEHLVTYAWYFDSPEKAQQKLNEQLEQAMEVSERGEKLNQAGERVGKRAVAYFRADASSGSLEVAKIIWTEGSVLRSIEGAYTYALEFESQQKGLTNFDPRQSVRLVRRHNYDL